MDEREREIRDRARERTILTHSLDDVRYLLSIIARIRAERDVHFERANKAEQRERREREGRATAKAAARVATELLDRQTKALARVEQQKAELERDNALLLEALENSRCPRCGEWHRDAPSLKPLLAKHKEQA